MPVTNRSSALGFREFGLYSSVVFIIVLKYYTLFLRRHRVFVGFVWTHAYTLISGAETQNNYSPKPYFQIIL